MGAIISSRHCGMRRCMKNFPGRRGLRLSVVCRALQFSRWVAPGLFTPLLGALYFRGGLPEGLKLAQAFGMFVAWKMDYPSRRVVVPHPGDWHARESRSAAEISALIAGIASASLLGSLVQITVAIEFATNQAIVFASRVEMIAAGGGGLLTACFRGLLCDTSVFFKLTWLRMLAHKCFAARVARRLCPRCAAASATVEGGSN
jgi:hypothetical protein